MTETGALSETRPSHIEVLTSIRFLFAVWIVLYHLRPHMEVMIPWWRETRQFTDGGFIGIDFFFVLSGFIIAYVYGPRMERPTWSMYRYFLSLRLARMYPLHLLTLLATAALVGGASVLGQELGGDYSATAFVRQLFLVTAWGPPDDLYSWNYPAWSLSAEWAGYLAFPLIAVASARVRSVRASIVGIVVSLGLYLAVLVLAPGLAGSPLIQIAAEFTAGIFLCRVYLHMRRGPQWDVIAGLSLVTMLTAAVLVPGNPGVVAIPFLPLVVLSLALSTGRVRTFFTRPRLVALGEASFALYMTHALGIMVLGVLLPLEDFAGSPGVVKVGVLGVYAVLLLAVAVATTRLVERPVQVAWRRRLVDPTRKRAAAL